MISYAMSLLVAAASPAHSGGATIPVSGRDNVTLADSSEVIRGLCDGREASVTIQKAYRGRNGSVTMRSGTWSRELPSSFLNGQLVKSSFYAAGLGCDGRAIMFRARLAQLDRRGRARILVQSATMDLRTGSLTVSRITNASDRDVRNELRPR